MRVGGRASQVSAFLDHPGRFYVCGKMDLNTKLFEGVMFDAPSSHEWKSYFIVRNCVL
jgi:hypothetical protein